MRITNYKSEGKKGLVIGMLMKRFPLGLIILLVLSSALFFIPRINTVKESEAIYIRADGSVDPPTAPITSVDNVTYTFTDNINVSARGGEELEELWLDEFTSYNPRWSWGYNAGTGYKFLTTIEGYSVCESGITAESTSFEYSDCDLHTFFSISETDELVVEMRLRTTDDNGITGIGQGSRGWGFWDGSQTGVNLAWFWSASPESDPYVAGFHATVKRDDVFVLHEDISYIDMRQWHVYRIDLLESGTEFRVDGVLVASTSIRPRTLNQLNLWIDNYVFQFVDGELQRGYLDVDQDQKMYIDWVKMSRPRASPVGGIWIPVDKFGLLAPYIVLASTIVLATVATAVFVKYKKKQ